jgi:hypothetical protein
MNKTLVFKNTKSYDQFVTTPNGAGRRLPSGKCVSGSFYIHTANMGMLTHVPEHMVNEDDILWNAEVSGYQYPQAAAPVPVVSEPAPVEPVAPVPMEEPVKESVVEPPVVKETKVAPVVEEALSAGDRELYRMGMEELKMIAATKGIDFPIDIKKKKLIAMINYAK